MPSYKKFTDDEISLLNELLRKTNNYPSRRKINEMANFLKTSPLKIENWLKYNRRKLYFNGNFDQYKIRKKFSEEEISYLRRKFKENKNPDFQECQAISKELNNISGYQIKNWFANQRRKRRNAMKKQKALRIQSIKINKYVQKTNNFEKKSKEFSELDAKKAIENDTHDKKCDNYEKPNEFSPQVKKEKINQTIKIEENMIKKEIIPDMHLINFRNYSTNINTSNFQPCVPFLQTNTTKNLVNDSTNYGSLPLSFNQKQPWVQTSIGNPAFTQINGNNFILNNRNISQLMMGPVCQIQKNCNFQPSFQMNSVNFTHTSPYLIGNLNNLNEIRRRNSQIIQSNVVFKQNPLHTFTTVENIKINSLEYQGFPTMMFSNARI